MFKRLLSRLSGPGLRPEDLSVEEAIDILSRASAQSRAIVAQTSQDPKILEYLAEDQSSHIRAQVAGNAKTPRPIDAQLADDVAEEVRLELAAKIARLLPDLEADAASDVRDMTIGILERLANDSLPRVRQIVAEEIKSSHKVPGTLVQDLARDAERAVAAPILEFSPLLSDQDLTEIIAAGQAEGVLEAIARRKGLSEDVSDAVVASLDVPAVAALLANPSACIRAEALETVAHHAEEVQAWHEGLVLRPDLSVRAVRRIAGFVAVSLLMQLGERHGLDDATRQDIQVRVKERLAAEETPESVAEDRDMALRTVLAAHENRLLDDAFVIDALKTEDRTRAMLAVAVLAGVAAPLVERIVQSRNGKMITALAWHAGLTMRTAFQLQKDLAKVAGTDLVPARGGTDYPFTPETMRDQLEIIGIPAKSSSSAS